jgi:hypothetical protein
MSTKAEPSFEILHEEPAFLCSEAMEDDINIEINLDWQFAEKEENAEDDCA